ncbi:hypothetical protein [Rhodobacter calidifons]|uniref:Lipase (Class 3) n=1 Tax=Rhodobacter calidifons TaxID=2715277 RepID=A0ABX0G744_9RHOB|nr:hypothetical protein [Rhodobacter calidifons]NHB77095.1 hypothetical protein [Rhodobacter calidifons]
MGVAAAGNRAGDGAGGTGTGVFRRRVLYIPGYDPFPPRRYRELYRTEGAAQAVISGHELSVAPGQGEGYGWQVHARIDGREVEAAVEVLVWSDLVRASMGRGIAGTYAQLVRTAWLYLRSGALFRLIRLRKGPMIAALYPAVLLVLQGLVALALGALLLRATSGLPWGLGWLLAAGAVWAVLAGFRRLDRRLFVYYLMHDYAYTTIADGAYPPALEARLAQFRGRVRAALASGVDEVLVVGHSSGVHLGVSVLADLIREGVADRPALGFLSLGHAVPMVSFLPGAARLRGDLAYLSTREEVTWVDVSAPGDGCSFALCDPVAVSGVAPPGQRWPLILSAAFTQTLSPERWRALRRRYFRLHFQYLCAFDRPGDYDYFRITAGPLTLAERFRGRKPSASRIATPLSPFRDVA